MVVTTLDDKLIKGGERLLEELDGKGISVDAALWFYFSDIQSWKLLLSLPEQISKGPKAAYNVIQQVILGISRDLPISLDDIAVVSPNTSLLKLMRVAIVTGIGISGIRFSNNVINGQLIEDTYIYRLMPINSSVISIKPK